jgi:hypothetical protein
LGDGGVVTIQQLTDPSAPGFVGSGVVELVGVVATSTKFLVSKGSSGSCLWGVFVSSPGLAIAAPHSAILAVSFGTPATPVDGGKAYCPDIRLNQPAGDAFPDDTQPGDVLTIVGTAGSYIPSTCTLPDAGPPNVSDVPQYQLSKVSLVSRTGTNGQVPAPYTLTTADVASFTAGADAAFFGAWGGARVSVLNVQTELQAGSLLDVFGHMLLTDGLQIGDKIYYDGFAKAQDACYSSPTFTMPTPTFNGVAGYVYLDYCTWNLQPANKCHDLSPPSADCALSPDAGPSSTLCTH